MLENSRQTIAPHPFSSKHYGESRWRELVTLFRDDKVVLRYLTSKLVFTDLEMSYVEIVTLFEAFNSVISKIAKEENLRKKYGSDVFTFRAVYQSLEYLISLPGKERKRILQERYSFYKGTIFSERYFKSVEGQAQQLYLTRLRERFPHSVTPKAYIGKGYGDHGTAKNSAYDASPSWQEVGLNSARQENQKPEKVSNYWEAYKVHVSQRLDRRLSRSKDQVVPERRKFF